MQLIVNVLEIKQHFLHLILIQSFLGENLNEARLSK